LLVFAQDGARRHQQASRSTISTVTLRSSIINVREENSGYSVACMNKNIISNNRETKEFAMLSGKTGYSKDRVGEELLLRKLVGVAPRNLPQTPTRAGVKSSGFERLLVPPRAAHPNVIAPVTNHRNTFALEDTPLYMSGKQTDLAVSVNSSISAEYKTGYLWIEGFNHTRPRFDIFSRLNLKVWEIYLQSAAFSMVPL
jgi:hypothetical protein